ncbi:2-iminoacetate synthase [Parafrankia irregularis]|uniref:2-iminoacetate synthase n=1 Tax=Parafrankia irregularis TaxID=795642 RepID=A0A0S4QY07_9ACTN|nr:MULTISPECIES: 2-iminoacetate synthase ThiH [Parafrankia]MBE3206389.1 2-iminoacetate synthase ThiH [Parafrankia sp. CH37]CUU60413.1 2-iminoacetate synthase [Parafrankia irregularis]
MASPPGLFAHELAALDIPGLARSAREAGPAEVDAVLRRAAAAGRGGGARGDTGGRLGLADLAVLLSPAATGRLEELAQLAQATTLRRFGRAVRMFAPLYVSNACLSSCTYCGFAKGLEVARRTLTPEEAVGEARLLVDLGFRHLLLVSGEHRIEVSADYLVDVVERLRPFVPSISIETQTWSDDTYTRLVAAGLEGAIHYQETYDRARYAEVHVAGWKRDFDRRLASFERAARAGVRRLGLGVLLGLAPDWRADILALAAHASFLSRRFWRTEVSVALPRIKPSASGFPPTVVVSDAQFVQAHAALRLFEPDVAISLSTREPAALRDGLARIAVTTMSAGSSTEPGGYGRPGTAQEQFSISDERSPADIAAMLVAAGYEPVWKDAFPLVDASR